MRNLVKNMFSAEAAETLALQALAWILADDGRAQAFMVATGASPSDLALRAGEPIFLGAVLDMLLGDDTWVMEFCQSSNLPCTAPMAARAALPGGDLPHWT